MRALLIFVTLFILFLQDSFAKATVLQKTLEKYSKAKTLQTDIYKTDEKIILGTKTESTGSLRLEKNKIFISQSGEKKTDFYYNNNVLTLVEFPDADFAKDGNRKVTTLKKKIPPFVKSLLNLFSNPKGFNKDFKLVSETPVDNEVVVELKPSMRNLKNFTLKINPKDNEIKELIFVDDVDTRTTIKFSKIVLNKKFKKDAFLYTRLKTDEVITE